MSKRRLRQAFTKVLNTKEDKPEIISGNLGVGINGQEVVEVPGKNGYVYVRVKDSLELIQAKNTTISQVYDLPVLCTRDKIDPQSYTVIGRDILRYSDWGNTVYQNFHAAQHSKSKDFNVGADPVWIYNEQFMPFLVGAYSPSGTSSVYIQPSPYNFNGDIRYAGGTGTKNISTLRPTVSGTYVHLLYLNAPTGNFDIVTGTTVYDPGITGTADVIQSLPDLVDTESHIPIAAIRTVSGTNIILDDNIYPLTPYINSVITGSVVDRFTGLLDTLDSYNQGSVLFWWDNIVDQNTGFNWDKDNQVLQANLNTTVTGTSVSAVFGEDHSIVDCSSILVGGYGHTLNDIFYSNIIGDSNQLQYADYSFIGGFNNEVINSMVSSLLIGDNHNVNSSDWINLSGRLNDVSGSDYSIINGFQNNIYDSSRALLVGQTNTITNSLFSSIYGGQNNNLRGNYSSAIGQTNSVSGSNSHVIGTTLQALHDGVTLLGDKDGSVLVSQSDNEFAARFSDGFRFITSGTNKINPDSSLEVTRFITSGTTTLNGVEYTWPTSDGQSGNLLSTDGAGQLSWTSGTVNSFIVLTTYDAQPARGSESNIHGGLLSLATSQPLDSSPTNINVTKGIGKMIFSVNAGSDFTGDIIVSGTSIDRNTGASTPDASSTISVDVLTTDNSDTDSNGNTRHAFTNAYITDKWYHGPVIISTPNMTLTDVDVYHVSFEQFNDLSMLLLTTFDVNLLTTNVNAEFDAYLYSLEVTGDKCDIVRQASLNVGADGFSALANRYERLRRGNLNKILDGNTDGIWVDIHYSNSPAYIEDMSMKVWAKYSESL